jgi:hypothetical protein
MTRSILGVAACAMLASLLAGCIYADVRAPLSYGSATPGDANGNLGQEVTGAGCNTAILWLVAWGDGGYDAAVREAKAASNAPFLVDVKADTTYTNVLFGLYQHQCTKVTARVPGVAAASPAPAAASGGKAP